MTYVDQIRAELIESARVKERTIEVCGEVIAQAAARLVELVRDGGTVFFCGNGGSAADSQHLAAEFAGRYLFDRRPLPAHALTVNTSNLTAIGNDYGYDAVFSRQLRAFARPGDAVIGISTSGNSRNVIEAFKAAKETGVVTIAMVGAMGGLMAEISDYAIKVPSTSTPRIQETHITVGHILCGIIEREICGGSQ